MKSILYLLSLLVCLGAQAQELPPSPYTFLEELELKGSVREVKLYGTQYDTDSSIIMSWKPEKPYIQTLYNDQKAPLLEIIRFDDGREKIRTQYYYDAQQRLVKEVRQSYRDTFPTIIYTSYNAQGHKFQKITENTLRYGNYRGNWYTYDTKGNQIQQYLLNNSFKTLIRSTYDSSGLLTGALHCTAKLATADSLLLQHLEKLIANPATPELEVECNNIFSMRNVFRYDTDQRQWTTFRYELNGELSLYTLTTYDAQGRFIESCRSDKETTDCEHLIQVVYNAEGDIARYENKSAHKHQILTHQYTYDKAGNWIRHVMVEEATGKYSVYTRDITYAP